MEDLQSCLLGYWKHSQEEDTSNVVVYRPAEYNFPPSRGRMGIEFHADGKLIYYGIGRADGSEQLSGHWAMEAPNLVKIMVDSEQIAPFTLEVISCDEKTLKVKR